MAHGALHRKSARLRPCERNSRRDVYNGKTARRVRLRSKEAPPVSCIKRGSGERVGTWFSVEPGYIMYTYRCEKSWGLSLSTHLRVFSFFFCCRKGAKCLHAVCEGKWRGLWPRSVTLLLCAADRETFDWLERIRVAPRTDDERFFLWKSSCPSLSLYFIV